MKKLFLLIFVFFCFSSTVFSQTEHMKFMGIPLTGSIDAFQSKLAAKGIELDKEESKKMPVGQRAFYGLFADYEAIFFVYYDKNTKIVHSALVYLVGDEDWAEARYQEFKDLLEKKYKKDSDTEISTGDYEGHEAVMITTPLGTIYLMLINDEDLYPSVSVGLIYEDKKNNDKAMENDTKRKLDDI